MQPYERGIIMTQKELVSIITAAIALIVSIISVIFSIRLTQKKNRQEARNELVKMVSKLNDLFYEERKLRLMESNASDYWLAVSRIKNINNERRVIVNIVESHIKNLNGEVDNMVYVAVATTYEAYGRYDDAEMYWIKSIKRAKQEKKVQDTMWNRKGYAHHLSLGNRIDLAREQYQQALRDIDSQENSESNQSKFDKGELCRSWALAEARIGNFYEAVTKLKEAFGHYDKITYSVLKSDGLRFYKERIEDIKRLASKSHYKDKIQIDVPEPSDDEIDSLFNVPISRQGSINPMDIGKTKTNIKT